MARYLVVDALARARGRRYTSFDVVGAGPRVVAGIIKYAGFEVDLFPYERVIDGNVDLAKYDAIFISAMSSDKGALQAIVKKIPRDKTIVVGGPIGYEFYDLLYRNRRIGLVFVGEAEESLLKVLRYTSFPQVIYDELFNIKGLAFRDKNNIIFTGYPGFTRKELLDKIIPFTEIDKAYPNYAINRYYVEIGRGCSNFNRPLLHKRCIKCGLCLSDNIMNRIVCPRSIPPGCGFCSVPALFGFPRSRSINSIVKEVESLVEHGARRIVLSSPDFLDYMREELVAPMPLTTPCRPHANYDAIEQLLSSIHDVIASRRAGIHVFIENIKACLVDERVAAIMGRYLRDTPVHIGLETGSYNYNLLIGKPISPTDVLKAVKLLKKNGLRPYVYLMYGLPGMDEKVYQETVDTVWRLYRAGVEKITLYKFTPLPGTAFEDYEPVIEPYIKYIKKLKNIVDKINKLSKHKYLGKIIEAYIIENDGKIYGYPVKHGPVIFLGKGILESPCLARVRIIKVYSRHVSGIINKIIECY